MNISHCIHAAENEIHNVGRYLETGESVNWVSDSLSTAILWAMKAWLEAHGQKDRGGGLRAVRNAFEEAATEGLKVKTLSCLNTAHSLDFFLFGDGTDPDWRPLPMDKWKNKAYECLIIAEEVVNEIKNEIYNVRKD